MTVEDDMQQEIEKEHARAIELRTEARRDAIVMVARARQRIGADPTTYTALDADTVHVITDLLVQVQGQQMSALDPSFAKREAALARVARMTADLDVAIRGARQPHMGDVQATPPSPQGQFAPSDPHAPPAPIQTGFGRNFEAPLGGLTMEEWEAKQRRGDAAE